MITKKELKKLLKNATGCIIQHTGWCCATCFYDLSTKDKKLNNSDWQNLLLFRGSYKESDLNNLPINKKESLNKIKELAEYQLKYRGNMFKKVINNV